MRAIIFALVLGLAAPAWGDCTSIADVQDRLTSPQWSNAKATIYKDTDSENIRAGLTHVGTKMASGDRKFMVISWPDTDAVLVVGFLDGCFEDKIAVERHLLDSWLAGVKAGE